MRKKINFININSFENVIVFSSILFLVNLIFPYHSSGFVYLINELLLFITIFLLYKSLLKLLQEKSYSPLSLILNSGILAAILFFILSLTNSGFTLNNDGTVYYNFFNSLLSTLIIFVFIGSIVFIFTSFQILFFLRSKKDLSTYFNVMLFFLAISFLSNLLLVFDPSLDYPRDTFFIVSILLITINSVRVAWIAFLNKKQKKYLLIISIVLTVIYSLTFSLLIESNVVKKIIYAFSPGFHTIFSLVMIYGAIYFLVIFFTTLFHLPTAEAFDRKALQVSSLMDITKLMTQVFDFKELADTITAMTTEICNSNSAWLVTKENNKIVLNSVYKIGFVDADKISYSLLEKNNINEILVINNSDNKIYGQNYNSIVIAPLKVYDKINGYLFTARVKENNFDDDEIKSVEAFANYASVALENAMLIKKSIEKERLEKELDVAREIQRKILPLKTPKYDNLEISALFIPAFEVGGDYYYFFELDNNNLGFVVADVSGKGISAAFIMAQVEGVFESLSKMISSPKDILIKVNEILIRNLGRKNFVTAIYGKLNFDSGKLTVARAGHTPILYLNKEKIFQLRPKGIGLGLDAKEIFQNSLEEMEINLEYNDILVYYSDGIPEAKNNTNEDFGYKRLEEIVFKNRNNDTDTITNEIMKELSLFTKDKPQHDDITLLIFKWKKN
ncbi:MAG: SpoIIE family protein phosphatase [Melioribacteraceae bacterium]|nr:SpoIIE family protein phosphatase [Melioribacteraceae bacterium]